MSDVLIHGGFWLLGLLAVYSYFGYPLLLLMLPSRRSAPRASHRFAEKPSVTLIITAHNEAARIRAKIENVLMLPAYPGELEFIVASDASTDGTDDIVREFQDRGVRLLSNPHHDGKEAAQALAIEAARGDILVFSDVATRMEGDVFSRIAAHFADPAVGALSSTDQFITRDGKPAGEGAYVRYEMFLRRQESRVNSLIGLSGSFFAARREVCRKHWATTIPSDFMTAVNCARLGYVAISADDVVGFYADLKDPGKEYRRKVRTVGRGMRALAETPEILNPFRYGMFAIQIWSHKIMRWLAPWLLLAFLGVNFAIAGRHWTLAIALAAQLSFYAVVTLGALLNATRRTALVRIPYYFAVANLAVMHAACDFVRGRAIVTWTPSER